MWESQTFSNNEKKYLKLSIDASGGTRMKVDTSGSFMAKGFAAVGGVGSVGLKLIGKWECAKILYRVR